MEESINVKITLCPFEDSVSERLPSVQAWIHEEPIPT
jgi:hypothetical protein